MAALSCPGTLLENIGSIRHSRGSIFGLKALILSYLGAFFLASSVPFVYTIDLEPEQV